MPTPDTPTLALGCLAAFLSGSIPFGLILVKLAGKGDVRAHGSGNIGATNVSRVGGRGLGLAVLGLDILKGYAPVLGARHLDFHFNAVSLMALAAVLGHMYTPWLKFRGGKGVATALGVALAFDPLLVAPSFGIFALALLSTRYVSLGSILAAAALPVTYHFRVGLVPPVRHWWDLAIVSSGIWTLVALLVIAKHRENIARLLKGTESKLWGGSGTDAPHA